MVQTLEKRQVLIDRNKIPLDKKAVKFHFTHFLMGETFGQWLERKRKAAGLNQTELAERSRVTKATISLYELDRINQPRRSQVDKIAKALNVPLDEARDAAGYKAPGLISERPKSAAEFFEALERLGVPGLEFGANYEGVNDLTPEQYQSLLNDVAMVVELSVRRLKRDE